MDFTRHIPKTSYSSKSAFCFIYLSARHAVKISVLNVFSVQETSGNNENDKKMKYLVNTEICNGLQCQIIIVAIGGFQLIYDVKFSLPS